MTDARRLAERVLRLEAEAILALIAKLDARLDRAVALLQGCSGRVIVTGMGKSGLIGRKIAATLASTGTPAHFLHPAEGVHGDLGMVARGDVVLALSNSGETDEVLAIVPPLKRLGVPIILLTGNPQSTLARQCEVVLDASVSEEACPMNLAPTSSTAAALALGDALAMVVLERRGLRPEDFAALHPRGTLGWRALVRVADLMHTGDAVPMVREDVRMKDVDGVEATRRLRTRPDAPPVLVLTTFDDDEVLSGALRAGAAGFVLKDAPGEELIRSARTVAAGDAWLDPAVTERVLATYRSSAPTSDDGAAVRIEELTPRERDVLRLIGRGASNTEIAESLFVSEATVKSHIGHIFTKLDLRDRAAAIVFAFDHGLVAPEG